MGVLQTKALEDAAKAETNAEMEEAQRSMGAVRERLARRMEQIEKMAENFTAEVSK
jgi:hypothetical protein